MYFLLECFTSPHTCVASSSSRNRHKHYSHTRRQITNNDVLSQNCTGNNRRRCVRQISSRAREIKMRSIAACCSVHRYLPVCLCFRAFSSANKQTLQYIMNDKIQEIREKQNKKQTHTNETVSWRTHKEDRRRKPGDHRMRRATESSRAHVY